MPRDYKPRSKARRKRQGPPAWLWLLVGLIVGAVATVLVWVKLTTPEPASQWIGARPDKPPRSASPKQPAERPVVPPYKPRYQFYDDLRHKEVVVPEEQLDRREIAQAVDPTAQYLVQVGSFVRAEDADRMQAELALLGIETRVSKARLGVGKVRYRVQAGPYLGRSALDKARARLKQNGYRDLLVRIIR